MSSQLAHDFLHQLAANTEPRYAELITGIAEWFGNCGSLSAKQFASVELTARQQGRSVPACLREFVSETKPGCPPPIDELAAIYAEMAKAHSVLAGCYTRLARPK